MKRLFLTAVLGLAIAVSLGAQTTTPEERQEPAQKQGKAKVEQNTNTEREKSSIGRQPSQSERANAQPSEKVNDQEKSRLNQREGIRANDQEKSRLSSQERARANEQGESVSQSTTVFRNGHETSEHLSLHRSFREQSDAHFEIGSHDRDWWLRSYSIVLMAGCYYYLADDGCLYPAYGFDPSCNYSPRVVYCE